MLLNVCLRSHTIIAVSYSEHSSVISTAFIMSLQVVAVVLMLIAFTLET